MNKRTKFIVGLSLFAAAVTSLIGFFVLCAKKKGGWAALLALLSVAEGAGGYVLMEDSLPEELSFRRRKLEDEEEPIDFLEVDLSEILGTAGEEDLLLDEEAEDAE